MFSHKSELSIRIRKGTLDGFQYPCVIKTPFEMDRSHSLNAPPYFDGSNYDFWKVRMHAFLCAIDETIWNFVENGWAKPTTPKVEWDRLHLLWQMPIAKLLMLSFVVFLLMNFIGSLM